MKETKHHLGQTQDVGFQFGIRRTFPIPIEDAWNFMFSKKGLSIWLGTFNGLKTKVKFITKEGIEGLFRVFEPLSHIRLNWKKQEWDNMSTLQVRFIGNEEKTTISFHQEKLLNSKQRDEVKQYWNKIIERLLQELS